MVLPLRLLASESCWPRDVAQAYRPEWKEPSMSRTVTLYRDDSTVQVVYKRVKATFWTADNTVFVISQYTGEGPEHRYIHWPRERFCWFKDECK